MAILFVFNFLHLFATYVFNMGQARPIFRFFRPFLVTKTIKFLISTIQIEKSVGGVHGIRTQGHRMVGADKTMELFMSESSV